MNYKEILNYFSSHIISNDIGVVILILISREQITVLMSLGTNIFNVRKTHHKKTKILK